MSVRDSHAAKRRCALLIDHESDIATRRRAYKESTTAERREALALILEFSMPKNHTWAFGVFLARREPPSCGTLGCALGIAQLMWGNVCTIDFGEDVDGIFGFEGSELIYSGGAYDSITPHDVAMALRAYRDYPWQG